MKTEGKKGISPLIATVILIGFVVAISAIVMLWGRGFVEETAEKQGAIAQAKLACNNVDFKIYKTDVGLGYTIENIGTEKIYDFIIRRGGTGTPTLKKNLAPMGTIDISLSKNDEIIPRLRPEGAGAPIIPCSNALKTII